MAYALHAEPEQPFSYNVIAKSKLDAEAMREADVNRLEGVYALRLLKKIIEPAVDPKFKKGKGKGKGRRRGRGRGGDGGDTDSVQSDAEEGPSSAEEALEDQPADEHVPVPKSGADEEQLAIRGGGASGHWLRSETALGL